jgi:hypothetical protein
MPKKCPPGVICIESMTLVIIIVVVAYLIYQNIYVPATKIKNHSESNSESIPTVFQTHHTYQVPITVNTQRMETSYSQIGMLTRVNHKEVILPFYGRMVNTSRVKWQYYTMNDSNNQVRLPINVNGRSGTDEYGVDEVNSGDTVYVQGYDDVFKVTIYEKNRYSYNPL